MNTSTAPPARRWAVLVIGCVASLVPTIDMTALHLAVPNLIRDLHPSATQILWIADVYGFALAGLLVTMGGVGDRIGHKKLLLIGTALFAAASAVTAYAPGPELLIAARALLGVAGATIMPATLSLIRKVFTDPKERTAAIGIFTGAAGLGVGLGPVLAGAVLDHFWWGSVFLINVPIMALVLLAGAVLLPETRDPAPGRLDLVSVPLSIVGVLGIVYSIKEIALGGISQGRVLAAALIGVVALVLFVRRQARLAEPLIDTRLFRVAAFSGSVTANFFAMFALVSQSLVFTQYFQLVWGWSPLRAGLAGLPGAVAAVVGGGALAPSLINAIGRARTVALGLAMLSAGYLVYGLSGTGPGDYWILVAGMIPGGMGVGLALTVTSDSILASVPRNRSGAASAISETATELGGALGMAVLGSVLNAVYRNSLDLPAGLPSGAGRDIRDSIGAAVQSAAALPARLAGQVVDAARHAFVDAVHVTLYCSAGLAAAVAVTALFTLRGVPKVIPESAPDAGSPDAGGTDAGGTDAGGTETGDPRHDNADLQPAPRTVP